MGIEGPIFIVGPGRSGTTMLLHLLSRHPELTWFSGWTGSFPEWPQLSAFSRLNDVPALEAATRTLRRWPRPAEPYKLWNFCFPGFSSANRDWDEQDVNQSGVAKLTRIIEAHLKWHGKNRFLTKYTGWARFRFLRACFPDAHFIYIDRDPRAVVYSYMKQRWRFKRKPDAFAAMPAKERLELYAKLYLAYYQAKRQFEDGKDYLQVYYEQLVEDVPATLHLICEKTTLPFDNGYRRIIDRWDVKPNTNEAWQQKLSPEEQVYLTTLLEQPLKEMGYAC